MNMNVKKNSWINRVSTFDTIPCVYEHCQDIASKVVSFRRARVSLPYLSVLRQTGKL